MSTRGMPDAAAIFLPQGHFAFTFRPELSPD